MTSETEPWIRCIWGNHHSTPVLTLNLSDWWFYIMGWFLKTKAEMESCFYPPKNISTRSEVRRVTRNLSRGQLYLPNTQNSRQVTSVQRCLTLLGKGQLVGRWVEGIVLAKAGRPHEAGLRANPLVWNAVKIPLHEWDRNEPVHPPSATIETLKIKSLKMHRLFKISQRR